MDEMTLLRQLRSGVPAPDSPARPKKPLPHT